MNLRTFFVLILCLCSFSSFAEMSCDNVEQTNKIQCETLKDFWFETGGHNWSDAGSNGWLESNNPCTWKGITCWGANVVRIYRGKQNLTGHIPDLSGLHNLRTLDVNSNNLSGPIPDLTKNKNLEDLYLFNNEFWGLLPDFTKTPLLKRFYIFNNPGLVGPMLFGGDDTASQPVFSGTNMCRSRHLDYKHWTAAVASLTECSGKTVPIDLSAWGVLPNDGKEDSHAINHMLSMYYYDQGEYPHPVIVQFEQGVYELDNQIKIHNQKHITLSGSHSYADLPKEAIEVFHPAMGTVFKRSDKFIQLWDKQLGSMIAIFGSLDTKIENIALYGNTQNANINVKDHGINIINSCGTQLEGNALVDFGGAAVSDYSVETDMSQYACNGPSTSTQVKRNNMANICEISTDGSWYGSYGLNIEENTIHQLKCSVKLFSPNHINSEFGYSFSSFFGDGRFQSENLRVVNNLITGPGHDYSGYANGVEVSGYSHVLIEGNTIKNGPNFAIAVRSHQNNYTVEEFNWGDVKIVNNTLDNYKQAIYVWNWERQNGFYSSVSNIEVSNNLITSSWNSNNQAHIHIIGDQYSNSSVHNNVMYGGQYGVWRLDTIGVQLLNNKLH